MTKNGLVLRRETRRNDMGQLVALAFDGFTIGVATHDINGVDGPWFVASDLAKALGFNNKHGAPDTSIMLRAPRLADGERSDARVTRSVLAPTTYRNGRKADMVKRDGVRCMNVINEAGLYKVLLTSTKPEAGAFLDWVAAEVLPSIRKTGSYGTPPTVDERVLELEAQLEMRDTIIRRLTVALKTLPVPVKKLPPPPPVRQYDWRKPGWWLHQLPEERQTTSRRVGTTLRLLGVPHRERADGTGAEFRADADSMRRFLEHQG